MLSRRIAGAAVAVAALAWGLSGVSQAQQTPAAPAHKVAIQVSQNKAQMDLALNNARNVIGTTSPWA
jgi:hypothetical protein